MRHHTTKLAALLLMTIIAIPAAAGDWSASLGIHDYAVPDVSSHTLGIDGGIYYNHTLDSGTHVFASYEILIDHDKDELDPDHIPVWWKIVGSVDRDFYQISPTLGLSWLAEYDGMRNTVSSIEFRNLLFTGISLDYQGDNADGSLKAEGGLWVLEIDDDVPKERGYARGDFLNKDMAYSLVAQGGVGLGKGFRLTGRVQHWGSGGGWLEEQAEVELIRSTDRWKKGSRFVLDAEYSMYNLDPYTAATEVAPDEIGTRLRILPWDDDLFIRLYFEFSL